VISRALALTLVAAVLPLSASASHTRFSASAHLRTTGCKTTVAATKVTITGCSARARFTGTSSGTLEIGYSARVNLSRGTGAQLGTATLHGARAADVLALRFTGTVTLAGTSRGTWTATHRSGTFAHVPKHGTYATSTPDQGAHVVFDVRA
jgi:hypothetical protein